MSKLAKPFKPQMDAPYFDHGDYLFEVMISKTNARGEPYLNLKCIGSFDGRRVNSYYGLNFFIQAESVKQRELHERLLTSLVKALGIKELTDMDQIPVGTEIAVHFSRAGFNPLPSFMARDKYSGYIGKPDRFVAATSAGGIPPVNPNQVPDDVYEGFTPTGEDMDEFFDDTYMEFDAQSSPTLSEKIEEVINAAENAA